jgi:hypothetical protein
MGVPFLASKFRLDVRYKQSMHSILVFISLLGEIDKYIGHCNELLS